MFFFKRHSNEDDDFAKLVSSLGSDLHLPQDVRLRAKANLFLMIRDVKRGSAPARQAFKPRFVLRFAGSIAVIVLLVATSSVGVVRADDSKPGDALFPLDKFIENAIPTAKIIKPTKNCLTPTNPKKSMTKKPAT